MKIISIFKRINYIDKMMKKIKIYILYIYKKNKFLKIKFMI